MTKKCDECKGSGIIYSFQTVPMGRDFMNTRPEPELCSCIRKRLSNLESDMCSGCEMLRRRVDVLEIEMPRKGTLQVAVPPDVEDRLKAMAKDESRTLSNMILRLVEEAIRNRDETSPPRHG